MGSDSDLEVMKPASEALAELGIEHEIRVVSAHRTPEDMVAYGKSAEERGLKAIIAATMQALGKRAMNSRNRVNACGVIESDPAS
jgi:phosphoribosylaminoimidazole carboxylase PurE protein